VKDESPSCGALFMFRAVCTGNSYNANRAAFYPLGANSRQWFYEGLSRMRLSRGAWPSASKWTMRLMALTPGRVRAMKRFFVLLMGTVATPAMPADVFKCLEDGKVVYSDRPCPAGSGKAISVKPAHQSAPDPYGGLSGYSSPPNAVAPPPGSKQGVPARSLDGHFEDRSYDTPRAAAAAADEMRTRRGDGSSYGSAAGAGTVYTGPRGGQYTITSGGNRSYIGRK